MEIIQITLINFLVERDDGGSEAAAAIGAGAWSAVVILIAVVVVVIILMRRLKGQKKGQKHVVHSIVLESHYQCL